jgi:hypothetical protein
MQNYILLLSAKQSCQLPQSINSVLLLDYKFALPIQDSSTFIGLECAVWVPSETAVWVFTVPSWRRASKYLISAGTDRRSQARLCDLTCEQQTASPCLAAINVTHTVHVLAIYVSPNTCTLWYTIYDTISHMYRHWDANLARRC